MLCAVANDSSEGSYKPTYMWQFIERTEKVSIHKVDCRNATDTVR
jgi:hypothetical protein